MNTPLSKPWLEVEMVAENGPVNTANCPSCRAPLPAGGERCDRCGWQAPPGHAVTRGTEPPPTPKTTQPPLLDRPWVILSLLFFVMAILGLPLLWKSRAFGLGAKILLSLVVTLYTAALFAGVAGICYWAYRRVVEAM